MKYSIKQGDKLIHKDKYLLSLKDLNTLEIIDDLIEAGIKSLKIEGRLKSKEYTAGVVSIYRKNVDKIDADINKDMDTLKQLFSRGDQTKGYYLDRKDMINREIGKHVGLVIGKSIGKDKVELIKEIKKGDKVAYFKNGKTEGFESDRDYPVGINKFSNVNLTDVINIYKTKDKALTKTLTNLKDNYKMDININFYADKDNVSITLYNDKYSISESIKNNTFDKALDKERLEQQLRKFGSTSFRVVNMDIEGEAVLVSIKEINELRRLAAEKLKEEVLKINRSISNTHIEKYTEGKVNKTTSVLVKDIDQYNIVKKFKDIDKIYVEGFIPEDKEVYYVLPMIDKVSSEKAILEVKDKVKGFVVRTYGQFKICRDNNIDNIVLDYTFNIYNNESARFYKDYIVTESVENKGIIGENVETIVYGKIKVMTMNQCISGTCDKSSNKYTLVDRMNEEYILEADCKNCINYIYSRNNINSKKEKGYIRYNFSFETPKEIRDILISHGYVL
jgi:putative protease